GRDRHQGAVALKQLRGLRPRSVSEGALALVPVVIAAVAAVMLVLSPGSRPLLAAAAFGLVLTTAAIWLKDRRDEARHQAAQRRVRALQHEVVAAGEAEQKELSRILYFTGAGPHTKATVGNIRKDLHRVRDRKSTRLNSSHVSISYAVFCLKKKNKSTQLTKQTPNIANARGHIGGSQHPTTRQHRTRRLRFTRRRSVVLRVLSRHHVSRRHN